jgi:hypothetical protein
MRPSCVNHAKLGRRFVSYVHPVRVLSVPRAVPLVAKHHRGDRGEGYEKTIDPRGHAHSELDDVSDAKRAFGHIGPTSSSS